MRPPTLGSLADFLQDDLIALHAADPTAARALPIRQIACDSKAVGPGDLFVAIEGFKVDGHQFIEAALLRGAVALAVRDRRRLPAGCAIPVLEVASTRRALALLSAASLGWPGHELTMVGVTGTNGKTTTTILLESMLAYAGRKPGLVGTMFNRIAGRTETSKNTTPESLELQQLLARMRDAGHDCVVMEVSSHGLALDRTVGCAFDVGVFTNLTQDHLDFHADMESYFLAKRRLFDTLGMAKPGPKGAVLNADDPSAPRIHAVCQVPVWTYGLTDAAMVQATSIEHLPAGVGFHLRWPGGSAQVQLRLCGLFNVYNALAAFTTALALGLDATTALEALQQALPVRGRFETVDAGQPFRVLVDYAHTPDGLENILQAARAITQGRVLVVFGCGGDRDNRKRPVMGSIATRLADRAFITSDNPRTEPPAQILEQVAAGASLGTASFVVIEDRRHAIAAAIAEATPGDTVVIAGKGHETYQILGDRTIDFDDVAEARHALAAQGHQDGDRVALG